MAVQRALVNSVCSAKLGVSRPDIEYSPARWCGDGERRACTAKGFITAEQAYPARRLLNRLNPSCTAPPVIIPTVLR